MQPSWQPVSVCVCVCVCVQCLLFGSESLLHREEPGKLHTASVNNDEELMRMMKMTLMVEEEAGVLAGFQRLLRLKKLFK